jgi:nitrogen fixation protein FixH
VTENPATQDAGDLRISLSLNPYPPTVSKSSEFTVTLTKVSGQAISDAAIRLDLTMPGMYMPPNQLTLLSAGNGTYTATGPFTMRGPWRIEVLITISGKTQSVFFDVWL